MTYLEYKEKEELILYLIEHRRLISLEKVANDFGCSTRTIKRMINNLRMQGNEIQYCRKSRKYLMEK